MNAAIISVGDELVSGLTVDTNSAWMAEQLAAVGVRAAFHVTVGDEPERIAAVIRQACPTSAPGAASVPREGDILLISGGLGPTEDDVTRQALAAALGEKLVEDAAALAHVEKFFATIRRPMVPSNRLQALRPETAGILENTCGTAPGLRARLGTTDIFVMPGVPREMKEMFTRSVLPAIHKRLTAEASAGAASISVRRVIKINTFGAGESALGETIQDLMVRGGFDVGGAHVSVGTTVYDGVVSVRIYASGPTESVAAAIDLVRQDVVRRVGPLMYGEGDLPLEAVVAALLREKKCTVATAESCTGGLLATMLTNTAGSSDYFQRGWVTYANAAKQEELAVPAALLEQYGAVSEEVARAMAQGARQAAGTDIGISTTGVAGPGGGSPEKPVGTVWIGISLGIAGSPPEATITRQFIFPGNRSQVRLRAAQMALALLRWKFMAVESPV